MILLFILYFLFGSAFTFGKIALSYLSPILFIGVRMSLSGLVLLGYIFLKRPSECYIRPRDWGYFFLIMITNIYCAYNLEFWAMQYISAAKASLLYNLSPFVTALVSHILLHHRLTKKQWIGLMIGCIGLIPILTHQGILEQMSFHFGFISVPEFVMILSVFCAALGWIIMKKLMNRHSYSPVFINGVTMLSGGILSFITSLIFEEQTGLIVNSNWLVLGLSPLYSSWLIFVVSTGLLILVANIIGYNIYGYLLSHYSPTFISFAGFTTPLFTALLDWILLGEIVPTAFYFSCVILLGGLYLFYQDELIPQKR